MEYGIGGDLCLCVCTLFLFLLSGFGWVRDLGSWEGGVIHDCYVSVSQNGWKATRTFPMAKNEFNCYNDSLSLVLLVFMSSFICLPFFLFSFVTLLDNESRMREPVRAGK